MKQWTAFFLLIIFLSGCDKRVEPQQIPVADFIINCGDCKAPCVVLFTNVSQYATSYSWDFGDGSSSIEKDSQHTFMQKGKYSIKLKVKGDGGEASVIKELNIGEMVPIPFAYFSFPDIEYVAPSEVIFANESKNVNSYLWNFGDGTSTSTEISPKHTFLQKGTFKVTLSATGIGGTNIVSKTIDVKSKEEVNIDDVAVVLEYNSLWDIHNKPDRIKYPNIRIQPDNWDCLRVLNDLSAIVQPEVYDFVLCYTLQEVPCWINSGYSYSHPGNNIGFSNLNTTIYKPIGWNRLRSVPSMNSLEFTKPVPDAPLNYRTSLSAFHEMGHFWGVFITAQDSVGPRNWKPDYPIAWLAAGGGHWSWVFKDSDGLKMPGIMYSGPTGRFNDFDLYIMGLMGYAEASKTTYTIYENEQPDKTHELRLDDLIEALKFSGKNYLYSGDGKRIPDTDPSMNQINVLVVVIKGKDEKLTDIHRQQLRKLKQDLDADWSIVTKNRSQISTTILRK
jgi:PKD repeat protein